MAKARSAEEVKLQWRLSEKPSLALVHLQPTQALCQQLFSLNCKPGKNHEMG